MESTVQHQPSRAAPLAAFTLAASAGFSVVYFGLPLLGAIERGPGIRIGIAVIVGLFLGITAATLARARSIAAIADAALVGEASAGLLRHRASRIRARWIGTGTIVASTGLVYLGLGELYASLNESRYEWDQLEMSYLEVGLSLFLAQLIGTMVWRAFDPGRYVDDMEDYVPAPDDSPP